jgi:prolyl oligopeptidase
MQWIFRGADISEDGRFLIVGVSLGTDPKNLLYYVDLAQLNYTIKGGLIH